MSKADIVILLDVSGSMSSCIDAVKDGVRTLVKAFSEPDPNGAGGIDDWRLKVCGYRDQETDGDLWFVDNPFVRDVPAIEAQLSSANMQASAGGDEPESLLDALYMIATVPEAGAQEGEDPSKWRAKKGTHRFVVYFTDATFKPKITLPAAAGGGVDDVLNHLGQKGCVIWSFSPEWSGHAEIASSGGAQWERIPTLAESPAIAGLGKEGTEGKAAQQAAVAALVAKAKDPSVFHKLLEQLGETLSQSASGDVVLDA